MHSPRTPRDLDLVDSPLPELVRDVTGLEAENSGDYVTLGPLGVQSTQRIAMGDAGGGVIVFTWPGELVAQARHLYNDGRAERLLRTAREDWWCVEMRPHLAYWHSSPSERLYMTPAQWLSVDEYVARWSGEDADKIGAHEIDDVRHKLWPFLLERGYATSSDTTQVEPFLERVAARKRDVHLRPGLCLIRFWRPEQVEMLGRQGVLADEIRLAINRILAAVDDEQLRIQR